MLRKTLDKFWITLFFLSIWLPLAGSFFKWNTSSELIIAIGESRRAATFPKIQWDLEYFDEFPKNFEAYYNDFFGFREGLISWNNFIRARILGSSPTDLVILGKYPWLFFGQLEDVYYRSYLYKPEELKQFKRILESRRDWLSSQGIRYIFTIAPNKRTAYPENLLDSAKYTPSYSRLDQITDYLQQYSNLEIVDLRVELRNAKANYRVYEKTDTHWNEVGAYFAYRALLNRVHKWFPLVGKPLELSDFTLTSTLEPGGDLARMLKLQPIYQEEILKLVPKLPPRASSPSYLKGSPTTPQKVISRGTGFPSFIRVPPQFSEVKDSRLPRAVIIGDSFTGKRLIYFLIEHFHQTYFAGQNVFDVELIQKEKPDLVIQEVVERGLVADFSTADSFLSNSAPIPSGITLQE
jgi:hypothetical protein